MVRPIFSIISCFVVNFPKSDVSGEIRLFFKGNPLEIRSPLPETADFGKFTTKHEILEKIGRTMLTCFSFASEKQESTVYSATGRLLFSVICD